MEDDIICTEKIIAERKTFFLDLKQNARGKVVRITEKVSSNRDRIMVPAEILDDFIMAIGICSPGLTSAPAIAEYIEQMVVEKFGLIKKEKVVTVMRKHKRLENLSEKELDKLIAKNQAWGRIVCRCEKITEAEIVAAIHSPLPATTVDAVKRRTRAGMGRCQGGFCGPKVMEIISRELNIPLNEVKKGGGAAIAQYKVKEVE